MPLLSLLPALIVTLRSPQSWPSTRRLRPTLTVSVPSLPLLELVLLRRASSVPSRLASRAAVIVRAPLVLLTRLRLSTTSPTGLLRLPAPAPRVRSPVAVTLPPQLCSLAALAR